MSFAKKRKLSSSEQSATNKVPRKGNSLAGGSKQSQGGVVGSGRSSVVSEEGSDDEQGYAPNQYDHEEQLADPEDMEIRYLQQQLGLKTTDAFGEKSHLIDEFRNDGWDEFFDIILPEASTGLTKGNTETAKFDPAKNHQQLWLDKMKKSGFYQEEEQSSGSDSDSDSSSSSDSESTPVKKAPVQTTPVKKATILAPAAAAHIKIQAPITPMKSLKSPLFDKLTRKTEPVTTKELDSNDPKTLDIVVLGRPRKQSFGEPRIKRFTQALIEFDTGSDDESNNLRNRMRGSGNDMDADDMISMLDAAIPLSHKRAIRNMLRAQNVPIPPKRKPMHLLKSVPARFLTENQKKLLESGISEVPILPDKTKARSVDAVNKQHYLDLLQDKEEIKQKLKMNDTVYEELYKKSFLNVNNHAQELEMEFGGNMHDLMGEFEEEDEDMYEMYEEGEEGDFDGFADMQLEGEGEDEEDGMEMMEGDGMYGYEDEDDYQSDLYEQMMLGEGDEDNELEEDNWDAMNDYLFNGLGDNDEEAEEARLQEVTSNSIKNSKHIQSVPVVVPPSVSSNKNTSKTMTTKSVPLPLKEDVENVLDHDSDSDNTVEMIKNNEEDSDNEDMKKLYHHKNITSAAVDVDKAEATAVAINTSTQKYLPPALRRKLYGDANTGAMDSMRQNIVAFLKSNEETAQNQRLQSTLVSGTHIADLNNPGAANYVEIRAAVKGLLNKIVATNMEAAYVGFQNVLTKFNRGDTNEALCQILLTQTTAQSSVTLSLLYAISALISILHKNEGLQVGSLHVEQYAHYLVQMCKKRCVESTKDTLDHTGMLEKQAELKHMQYICALFAGLYVFKVISSQFIYNLCEYIINQQDITWEDKVDLTSYILHRVGLQLRKEDPSALKKLVNSIQRASSSENSTRTTFLLDTLTSIRNNKVLNAAEGEQQETMAKFVNSKVTPSGDSSNTLTCSLEDVMNIEKKGRWWLVGAAFVQQMNDGTEDQNYHVNHPSDAEDSEEETVSIRKLLVEAKKQGMNTEVNQKIFVILMNSVDFIEAFEKINRVRVPAQQQAGIFRVIMHCCTQEAAYNPYYAGVMNRLVTYTNTQKFPCITAFWDSIKEYGNLEIRDKQHQLLHTKQTANLAKLAADMITLGGVDFYILKKIVFPEMPSNTVLFIHQFLLKLLQGNEGADKYKEIVATLHLVTMPNYVATDRDRIKEQMGFQLRKGDGREGKAVKKGLANYIIKALLPMIDKKKEHLELKPRIAWLLQNLNEDSQEANKKVKVKKPVKNDSDDEAAADPKAKTKTKKKSTHK